jgi:hypothetical protein
MDEQHHYVEWFVPAGGAIAAYVVAAIGLVAGVVALALS